MANGFARVITAGLEHIFNTFYGLQFSLSDDKSLDDKCKHIKKDIDSVLT